MDFKFFLNIPIGKICLFHTLAISDVDGKEMVVYQVLDRENHYQVCPANIFYNDIAFKEITEDEALGNIPIDLNPKYHFPELSYSNDVPPLVPGGKLSKSVAGMITIMKNSELIQKTLFDGFETDDVIEKHILEQVKAFDFHDDPLNLFHLIQGWGGISGRMLYLHRDEWNPDKIRAAYKDLIDTCRCVEKITEDQINSLIDAIVLFDRRIRYMGVAFITKHTRFWLSRGLGDDALPIFDSVMAKEVMGQNSPDMKSIKEYWMVMKSKADRLGISLRALERQIFKNAIDNPK